MGEPGNEGESLFPVGVLWVEGPHDGLTQGVMAGVELRTARVCQCHGALYIAEPFDGHRWVLRFAARWESAVATEAVSRAA